MKNTKHTEINDSSIEQDNQENLSQSKRKILTSIGVTSGVVGASALVPSTWVKPAVNSVILPAHAQSTPPVVTTPGSMMGTSPDPMMDTTPEATTPEPVEAAIVLSTMAITLQEGGPADDVVEADKSATYMVSLATMLAEGDEEVVVTMAQIGDIGDVSLTPPGPLTFTVEDQMPKDVVVATTETGVTATNAGGQEITIVHTASPYARQDARLMVTVVDNDVFTPDIVSVNVTDGDLTVAQAALYSKEALDDGELIVDWVHDENAQVEEYLVDTQTTGGRYMREGSYGGDIRTTGVLILEPATAYTVRVTAVFVEGGTSAENSATDAGTTPGT